MKFGFWAGRVWASKPVTLYAGMERLRQTALVKCSLLLAYLLAYLLDLWGEGCRMFC